ncbi:hypothetical protein F503_07143 [Ophiostoma piceae UAMH 11346]|uniref:Uncharacterized protein n=1 Tax=Ophiostoma piceae (strain UAMH 11346) TaxID=1262450 RepID=S3C936_OPHP1|nr:hypothetical protein F503_07143 [Ophiostoma piceae UAMH 11346]
MDIEATKYTVERIQQVHLFAVVDVKVMNITKAENIKALVDAYISKQGRIHILIDNLAQQQRVSYVDKSGQANALAIGLMFRPVVGSVAKSSNPTKQKILKAITHNVPMRRMSML